MLRNTLFILALAAAPAVTAVAQQQPAPAKPAHTMAADTTKAKSHRRARHAATTKAKPASHDTTARKDTTARP